MNLGPLRRIAYSVLGLAVGDAALVLLEVVRNPMLLSESHLFPPDNQTPQIVLIYAMGPAVSILGWVLVGLPVVLSLSSREIARTAWPILIGGGATLGPISLIVPLIMLSRGEIYVEMIGTEMPILLCSALVSGLAFLVYCALVRKYERSRAISPAGEAGALTP